MKNILKILFISAFFSIMDLLSQTNIQQIYFTDSVYINNFSHTTNIFSNKKNFYIQLFKVSQSYFNYEPRHGRWYRFLYNSNSFEFNMHNYLFGNGYMQCNPWPWYAYTFAEQFVFSKKDTNFILFSIAGSNCFEPFGYVRLTYNNGINYTQTQFYNEALGSQLKGFDIDPVNDSIIYIGFDMGYYPNNFFKSTNKGVSWINTDTIPNINMTLTKVVKVNPLLRNIIYIGLNKGLARSTNSGYMFTRANIDSAVVNSFHFDMIDSSIYVTSYSAFGNYVPGVFKSSDLGANWVRIFTSPCRALEIDPSQHSILYAGADSIIYRSTNGGLNWSIFHNGIYPPKQIIGICKNPGNDTFYVATAKGVYKIWGSYVGINKINSIVPESFSLSQNYPNPFNPVSKIKFDIPPSKGARGMTSQLIIYDILGREIATLVNEQLNPGTYEVEWDGSAYSSGIYFYRLETDEYIETKKMILIK